MGTAGSQGATELRRRPGPGSGRDTGPGGRGDLSRRPPEPELEPANPVRLVVSVSCDSDSLIQLVRAHGVTDLNSQPIVVTPLDHPEMGRPEGCITGLAVHSL